MPVPCPSYPPSMAVSLRSLSSSRGFGGREKRRDTGGRKWRKGLETGGSKGGPQNPRVGGISGADVEVQLISRGVKREGKREREGVIRWRARGMSQGLRWQIRRIYPYLLGALNSRDASTGAVSGCFLLNRLTFRCMRYFGFQLNGCTSSVGRVSSAVLIWTLRSRRRVVRGFSRGKDRWKSINRIYL